MSNNEPWGSIPTVDAYEGMSEDLEKVRKRFVFHWGFSLTLACVAAVLAALNVIIFGALLFMTGYDGQTLTIALLFIYMAASEGKDAIEAKKNIVAIDRLREKAKTFGY